MIRLVQVLCMALVECGVCIQCQFLIFVQYTKIFIHSPFLGFELVNGYAGVIAVGLFADNPIPLDTTNGRMGFFKSGDWYLLGVQTLSAFCLTSWGLCSTFILLYIINLFIPIRMDPNEELVGADLMEHRIRHAKIGISRAISALSPLRVNLDDVVDVAPIGMNPGHEAIVDELHAVSWRIYFSFYYNGTIHFIIHLCGLCSQANEKMRRWNDYYDSMDPKNKTKATQMQKSTEPKHNNSATNKYLSVFPRKIGIRSRNQTPATIIRDSSVEATAETNFQSERYINRNNDINPTPSNHNNKSNGGHTNFAWVH